MPSERVSPTSPLWPVVAGGGRRLNRETVTVKNIGSLALTLLAALALAPRLGAEITPGMTIDQTNAGQARDLLPPEIYEHYEKGEYSNKVVNFPNERYQW